MAFVKDYEVKLKLAKQERAFKESAKKEEEKKSMSLENQRSKLNELTEDVKKVDELIQDYDTKLVELHKKLSHAHKIHSEKAQLENQ